MICIKREHKIIYFKDELNDEFSGANIIPKVVDKNYKFIYRNPILDFCSLFLQNVFTMPIKLLYGKFKLKIKYIGTQKLKISKNSGYFIYANHTQVFGDTFIPSIPIFPKRNFFIVNPENISIKGLGNSTNFLGAIPIPNKKDGMKDFLEAIKYHIERKHSITIYPEAHIWPYYTKIRPFKEVSFSYPIKYNTPTFCITNTYQSYGKNKNKFKMVSYIDGPFYPDKGLSYIEQKKNLRDKIYNCMNERSKNSNIEIIKYIKVD